ncbi:MAG: hypothetical protein ACYC3G_00760 [Minisyncoccota bacterium]
MEAKTPKAQPTKSPTKMPEPSYVSEALGRFCRDEIGAAQVSIYRSELRDAKNRAALALGALMEIALSPRDSNALDLIDFARDALMRLDVRMD